MLANQAMKIEGEMAGNHTPSSSSLIIIIIMQKYDSKIYVAFGNLRIVDRFDFGHWNLGPFLIARNLVFFN